MKKDTDLGNKKGSTWYGGDFEGLGKRLMLTILLMSGIWSFGQTGDTITVHKPMYTVLYSQTLESPLKVTWTIPCTSNTVSRKGMNFKADKVVHTANDLDYLHSGYAKGHLADAADFGCSYDWLLDTFSYLNCFLQNPSLNDGVYRMLEEYCRDLANKYPDGVKVEVELHYSSYSKKLTFGATVPDGVTKTIHYGGMTEKYYFPNVTPTLKSFKDYKIN